MIKNNFLILIIFTSFLIFAYAPNLPDLKINNFKITNIQYFKTNSQSNIIITIFTEIINSGNSNSSSSTTYFFLNSFPLQNNFYLGTPPIPAGNNFSTTNSFLLSSPGIYNVNVNTDNWNQINESNENNNFKSIKFSV